MNLNDLYEHYHWVNRTHGLPAISLAEFAEKIGWGQSEWLT